MNLRCGNLRARQELFKAGLVGQLVCLKLKEFNSSCIILFVGSEH